MGSVHPDSPSNQLRPLWGTRGQHRCGIALTAKAGQELQRTSPRVLRGFQAVLVQGPRKHLFHVARHIRNAMARLCNSGNKLVLPASSNETDCDRSDTKQ